MLNNDFCLKVDISSNEIVTDILKDENSVFRKGTITIAKTGVILNKEGKILSDNEIIQLYKRFGIGVTEIFDGLYNLVVVDKKIEKAFIFHDYFCSESRVYYTSDGEEILISSSIKNIIRFTPEVEWYIDNVSVEEFIDNGFVDENKTMILDIYKTSFKKYTEFNLKTGYIAERNCNSISFDKKIKIDASRYDRIFDSAVVNCIKGNYAVDFMGDYNSTYILHHAKLNSPKKIKAYGVTLSETRKEKFEKICDGIKNVDLKIGKIESDMLSYLPIIVYSCEAAAFDEDAFKTVVLAKALKKDNVKTVVSSDGADGLFDSSLYTDFDKIKRSASFIADLFKNGNNKKTADNRIEAETLINIKLAQAGMIMNHYGISYLNPYMNRRFVQAVYKTMNPAKSKQFHNNTIKENVSQNVTNLASEKTLKFDILSLFSESMDSIAISAIAKKSAYFNKFKRKHTDSRERALYCLRIIYVEIFKIIFLGKNSEKLLSSENFNYSLKAFFPKYFRKED